jgi:preprotein translocase subunit SecG
MGVLSVVLTVFFVILCILLIILVLLQGDKSSGMGLLGGSSQSTFGSSTSDVITKITSVMVALFFILGVGLAVIESVKVRSLSEGIEKAGAAGEIRKQEDATPVETQPEEAK